MQLNVMTYNIASGRYYRNDADFTPNGSTRVVDLSKCADVIREIDPDFCGINEINHYKDEYVKIAKEYYGSDFEEYLQSMQGASIDELKQACGTDSFNQTLKEYIFGICPAFSYNMNF